MRVCAGVDCVGFQFGMFCTAQLRCHEWVLLGTGLFVTFGIDSVPTWLPNGYEMPKLYYVV